MQFSPLYDVLHHVKGIKYSIPRNTQVSMSNHTLTEFRTVVNCPVSQEQFWTYPQDCCQPPPVNSLSCTIYLLSLELKGSVWLNNNLSTPPPG